MVPLPPGRPHTWTDAEDLQPHASDSGIYRLGGVVVKRRVSPEETEAAKFLAHLGLPHLKWSPVSHEGEVLHVAPFVASSRLDLTHPDTLEKLHKGTAADTLFAEWHLRAGDRHGGNYLIPHESPKHVLAIDHDGRYKGGFALAKSALHRAMFMLHGPSWLDHPVSPSVLRAAGYPQHLTVGDLK